MKKYKFLLLLITTSIIITFGCSKNLEKVNVTNDLETKELVKPSQKIAKLSLLFDRIENAYYQNDQAIENIDDFAKIVAKDQKVTDYILQNPDLSEVKGLYISKKDIFEKTVMGSYLNLKDKNDLQVNYHRRILLGYRNSLIENYIESKNLTLDQVVYLYSLATYSAKKEMGMSYNKIKEKEAPIVKNIANSKISSNKNNNKKITSTSGGAGSSFKIKLIDQSGVESVFDCPSNSYILDAAEDNGITLPYSSRVGADATAAGWLSMGRVDQSDGSFLSDCQISYGYALLDVSYPLSDCIILTHMEERLIQCDLNEVEIHPDPQFPILPPIWPADFVPMEIYTVLLNGWAVSGNPPDDPCARLKKLIANMLNQNLTAQNAALKTHLQIGGDEWGVNEKLNSLVSGDYRQNTPSSLGFTNAWMPNFTWNAIDGYTTGYSHIHPDGSAPSPQDVFWLYNNIFHSALKGSSFNMAFYKENASFTTITAGEIYKVTINDWALLKEKYEKYLKNPQKFIDDYNYLANWYRTKFSVGEAEATQYALKGLLGNAIHLYVKGNQDTRFSRVSIDQILNRIAKTDCPEN